MSQDKYIILKLADGKQLGQFLRENISSCTGSSGGVDMDRLKVLTDRFEDEEGADIEEIVAILKGEKTGTFGPIQKGRYVDYEHHIKALGRRLERLLVRAGHVPEVKPVVRRDPGDPCKTWRQSESFRDTPRPSPQQEKIDAVMAKYGCVLYVALFVMDLEDEGKSEDEIEKYLGLEKRPK